MWTDFSGKRKSKVFEKYSDAAAELLRQKAHVQAIKDGHIPRPVDSPTLNDFLRDHYETHVSTLRAARTIRHRIKHFLPAFGEMRLAQITAGDIERFRQGLIGKKHVNTINKILCQLIAILNYAHHLGMLTQVPKIKRLKTVEREYRFLDENEMERLLEAAGRIEYRAAVFYALAAYAGLRLGEVCGLKWSDIDLENRIIHVKRSFDAPPKNGKFRTVPIVDKLFPHLSEWKELAPECEHVFVNGLGEPLRASCPLAGKTFHAALEAAGLPRIRFHDLRHSFASNWCARGGNLFLLQKILGHSSQAMLQRYLHMAPNPYSNELSIFGSPEPQKHENLIFLKNRTTPGKNSVNSREGSPKIEKK